MKQDMIIACILPKLSVAVDLEAVGAWCKVP